MKLCKAGGVALRVVLEIEVHVFMSSCFKMQTLEKQQSLREFEREFVCQMLHSFTQRHVEHAAILATDTDCSRLYFCWMDC